MAEERGSRVGWGIARRRGECVGARVFVIVCFGWQHFVHCSSCLMWIFLTLCREVLDCLSRLVAMGESFDAFPFGLLPEPLIDTSPAEW